MSGSVKMFIVWFYNRKLWISDSENVSYKTENLVQKGQCTTENYQLASQEYLRMRENSVRWYIEDLNFVAFSYVMFTSKWSH